MLASQFEKGESVFVGCETSISCLVEIDKAALDHENRNHRFWGVFGNHQSVSLASWFINVCFGLCDPVMLQVSPVPAHRISMNGANVIMRPDHFPGQPFQHDAESAARNIEQTRLEPNNLGVWHPPPIVIQIDVRDEVFATPQPRLESIGVTVKVVMGIF